jgi:AraC family transcriptional regulator
MAGEFPKGEYEEYTVPALTWAIFYKEGGFPKDLPELVRRIHAEWIPSSGYTYANGPDMEVLLPLNEDGDILNAEFEVWIPVKKDGDE